MGKYAVMRYWPFLSSDYLAIDSYLERMSGKGYHLVHIYRWIPFAKYEKRPPNQISYCADLYRKRGRKDFEEYRQLCELSGWEYISGKGHLKVFKAKPLTKPLPIQTDEEEKYRLVKSILLRCEILPMALLFVFGIYLLMGFSGIITRVLTSYSGSLCALFVGIFIIIALYNLFYLSFCLFLWKEQLKRGKRMEAPSDKIRKFRDFTFHFTFEGLVFLLLPVMFYEFQGTPYIVTLIIKSITVIAIGIYIDHAKENWSYVSLKRKIIEVAILVTFFIGSVTFACIAVLSPYTADEVNGKVTSGPFVKQTFTKSDIQEESGLEKQVVYYEARNRQMADFLFLGAHKEIMNFRQDMENEMARYFGGMKGATLGEELVEEMDLKQYHIDRGYFYPEIGYVLLQKDLEVVELSGVYDLDNISINEDIYTLRKYLYLDEERESGYSK